MKEFLRTTSIVLVAAVVLQLAVACGGQASVDKNTSQAQYNPATDKMGALAGIPRESDVPSGGVIPNLAPMVDAGKIAAANLETNTIKTAARAYYFDHPTSARLTSDDLRSPYFSGVSKARYHISVAAFTISSVDSVSGGWAGMVFSLSQQKWIKGTADGDHEADQDIP